MYPQVYIAPMARYIAFDWGLRRTGIAVTDSSAIVATPLKTVETKALFKEIDQIILAEPCRGIIVGVPGLIVGLKTDSSDGIEKFISNLEKKYPSIPIHKVDESDTSSEAMSALISGGMKKSKRKNKGVLDKVASAIILQRFLDSI
jgi:putative Holliday junction resolvase